MTINNLPEYARRYNYIVVKKVDNELWFYGAWNSANDADNAAEEIGGMVLPTSAV